MMNDKLVKRIEELETELSKKKKKEEGLNKLFKDLEDHNSQLLGENYELNIYKSELNELEMLKNEYDS